MVPSFYHLFFCKATSTNWCHCQKGQGSIGAFVVLFAGTAIIFPRKGGRGSHLDPYIWLISMANVVKCTSPMDPVWVFGILVYKKYLWWVSTQVSILSIWWWKRINSVLDVLKCICCNLQLVIFNGSHKLCFNITYVGNQKKQSPAVMLRKYHRHLQPWRLRHESSNLCYLSLSRLVNRDPYNGWLYLIPRINGYSSIGNENKHQSSISLVSQIFTSTLPENNTSWWFQPVWKIVVKLDHFPKYR